MIRGFTSGLSSFARFRLVEELRQAKWKPSPKTDADMECEFRLRRSRNDHTSLAKINPRPHGHGGGFAAGQEDARGQLGHR